MTLLDALAQETEAARFIQWGHVVSSSLTATGTFTSRRGTVTRDVTCPVAKGTRFHLVSWAGTTATGYVPCLGGLLYATLPLEAITRA